MTLKNLFHITLNNTSLYVLDKDVPKSMKCEWCVPNSAFQLSDIELNKLDEIKITGAKYLDPYNYLKSKRHRINIQQLRMSLDLSQNDILVISEDDKIILYGSSESDSHQWDKRIVYQEAVNHLTDKIIDLYGINGYVTDDYSRDDLKFYVYELLNRSSTQLKEICVPIFGIPESLSYASNGDDICIRCSIVDTQIILPFLMNSIKDLMKSSYKDVGNKYYFVVLSPAYYLTRCFQDINTKSIES